ncbi:MAG: glycoside hydrolase family 28 protein, partial [Bryobacteraceae bacterium]
LWAGAWLSVAAAYAGPATFDIRAYGAKGDGAAKDTIAIQKAIDAAAAQGGGIVMAPAGRYLSGTIHLKSNITLYLSPGAVILASPDNGDFDPYETLPFQSVSDKETTYFHYALVAAEGVHDIAIEGKGAIDGNRTRRGGPKTVAIKLCQRVTLRGITVRNSPNYSISFWGTDYIDIEGVSVLNGYADGIDPDSCRFVRIVNCYVDSWDDAICPKASPSMGMEQRRAVENLTVTNCVLRTNCSNFKFGTESSGDFKNATVSNCVMLPRDTGRPPISGVSLESVDGSHIDGVSVSNLTMTGVRVPVFIRLGNRARGLDPKIPGSVDNVSIANLNVRGYTVPASVTGLPDHRVRGVTIQGLHLAAEGGVTQAGGLDVPELEEKYPEGTMWGTLPTWVLYARHVAGLRVRDVDAHWTQRDVRPAMIFDDVEDLSLDGLDVGTADGGAPVLWLNNVAGALIRGARPPAAELFLRVSGAASRNLVLLGNDLTRVKRGHEVVDGAPANVLTGAGNARPAQQRE